MRVLAVMQQFTGFMALCVLRVFILQEVQCAAAGWQGAALPGRVAHGENGPTSFELNGPRARHFRRNIRVIEPRLTVSTQIASQGWDRTVPERDCREATIIRPIKLSLSFSVYCEVARVVGTNIALPADKSAVNRIGGQQMKKLQTQKFVGAVLFNSLCAGLVLAQPLKAPSNDPAAVDSVKQVGQDMGDAMVAGDIDKLNQIFADDWATVDSSGKIFTKEGLLSDFRSGGHKLEWFENGPIDVQVFGDVAVAQGSVKEKRTDKGQDTSGQFLWMDLLKKRAGKWAVVRSAGARVVSGDSPKTQSQDPTFVETMKQFAQDTGDAMVAGDVDKLNQIYADDWATVDSSGKIFTKESLLSDFKSGKHKLLSFEIGSMDVQAFGDVAVVQASVTEKRLHDGKDISGQFVFMDLLKKRDGKWVIVRTLGARVI